MSSGLLAGAVVIVTGGGQGIGRECALAYAREGAHVALLDVNLDAAVQTCAELATEGLVVECDVGSAASVKAAMGTVHRQFGRLDAIHNNAGISSPSRPLHETTEEQWDALQRVNLKSVYLTTRYGFEALKERKGSILNTASMVGLIGQSNHAAYVASKGGMIALTKAMALDYAPLAFGSTRSVQRGSGHLWYANGRASSPTQPRSSTISTTFTPWDTVPRAM